MRHAWWGLWHVRSGPAAVGMVVAALLVVVVFPHASTSVSVRPWLPPRGVGIVEVMAVVLAAVLPALTVPDLDGRELLGGRGVRWVHLVATLAVVLAPAVLIPVWGWRIHLDPDVRTPPVTGLLGTPILLACLGSVACLLLGRVCGVLAPPVAFVGLVVGQHLLPGSVLTGWFATGREWHSTWWLVALAPLLVAVVAWCTRGIPLPQRRG